MRNALSPVCVGLLLAASAWAGTITGTITARGAPEAADGGANGGNYQSHRYKFVEKIDYDTLTDFLVYVDENLPNVKPPDATPIAVTTQKNALFDPHILAI